MSGTTLASETVQVRIPTGEETLDGDLTLVPGASGLVIFVHGSGSSRFSSRNRFVATHLQSRGLATLLMDLLTPDEERVDLHTRALRFDIPLLAARVTDTLRWAHTKRRTREHRLGLFGASTGAAAALIAAADHPDEVSAVVSRGGRPDLAAGALPRVRCPTLLLVGGLDRQVLELNEEARAAMRVPVELAVIPGATHLFEEPGTLEKVAREAADFFHRHLGGASGGDRD